MPPFLLYVLVLSSEVLQRVFPAYGQIKTFIIYRYISISYDVRSAEEDTVL